MVAVSKVPAMGQVQPQNGVAGLQYSGIRGLIGL